MCVYKHNDNQKKKHDDLFMVMNEQESLVFQKGQPNSFHDINYRKTLLALIDNFQTFLQNEDFFLLSELFRKIVVVSPSNASLCIISSEFHIYLINQFALQSDEVVKKEYLDMINSVLSIESPEITTFFANSEIISCICDNIKSCNYFSFISFSILSFLIPFVQDSCISFNDIEKYSLFLFEQCRDWFSSFIRLFSYYIKQKELIPTYDFISRLNTYIYSLNMHDFNQLCKCYIGIIAYYDRFIEDLDSSMIFRYISSLLDSMRIDCESHILYLIVFTIQKIPQQFKQEYSERIIGTLSLQVLIREFLRAKDMLLCTIIHMIIEMAFQYSEIIPLNECELVFKKLLILSKDNTYAIKSRAQHFFCIILNQKWCDNNYLIHNHKHISSILCHSIYNEELILTITSKKLFTYIIPSEIQLIITNIIDKCDSDFLVSVIKDHYDELMFDK